MIEVKKGSLLFDDNEEPKYFYVVLSGRLQKRLRVQQSSTEKLKAATENKDDNDENTGSNSLFYHSNVGVAQCGDTFCSSFLLLSDLKTGAYLF